MGEIKTLYCDEGERASSFKKFPGVILIRTE
jgi:hypothetical protein